MIQYVNLEMCRRMVFPFIHEILVSNEPAPEYEHESDGMENLSKVLGLVQSNDYYPSLYDKSSYIICSIAGSQYFSNGNKRLAVSVLLLFLAINDVEVIRLESGEFQQLIRNAFPGYRWDNNKNVGSSHPLFLYNLAIVIGDRTSWGFHDFSRLKENVADIFRIIYKR